MKANKKARETIGVAVSVISAVAFWQVLSLIIGETVMLASPVAVAKQIFELIITGGAFHPLILSFTRIAAGFLLGFIIGILLAVISSEIRIFETLLKPYMVTVKSVPVASFVVIALVWLSSSRLSVFISFLIVLPVIYNNVLEGIKSTDRRLIEMADVFEIPFAKRLRYIRLPSLKPFLLSAAKTGAGLAFKSGIAAEIIGIPQGSVGAMLYDAKIYLDTAGLFAWTVLIVIISVAFEKLLVFLLTKLFERLEKI